MTTKSFNELDKTLQPADVIKTALSYPLSTVNNKIHRPVGDFIDFIGCREGYLS